MYESFLVSHGLWFSIPELLLSYCARRCLAISQLSIAAIWIIMTIITLGAESGVSISAEMLEKMTSIGTVTKAPSYFYLSLKHKIIDGAPPSKTTNWQKMYFFVKFDKASVFGNVVPLVSWREKPAAQKKHNGLSLEDLLDGLQAVPNQEWKLITPHRTLLAKDFMLPATAGSLTPNLPVSKPRKSFPSIAWSLTKRLLLLEE